MKALLATLTMCFALTGCIGTMPPQRDAEIIVKYKYIINTIPAEMLEVPAPVPNIDAKTADDKTVGNWMLDSEKRALAIEDKLKAVKDLQDKRLEEAKKLPKEDVIIK